MYKHCLHATVLFLLLFTISSCRTNVLKGEGNKTTATPVVAPFNAVQVQVSLKTVINVQSGATPGLKIDGYENLLKHIKTKVENNTLVIYSDLDDSWRMESGDVVAEVTMPAIKSLTLKGAPNADVHGTVAGSDFLLDISGASETTIDSVSVDKLSVEVSGAGDVDVKGGTAKHASYRIEGAGHFRAFPVQSEEVITDISGAGDCQVTATKKLTAKISGAGSVSYKGHPEVSKDVSGAGSVSEAK